MANKVTPEDFQKQIDVDPVILALESKGITLDKLADCLEKELKAKEIKVFNDKGTIIYSEGVPALDIRQRARIDAHKLRGDYPAEKHEVSGSITVDTGIKRDGDE